MSGCQSFCGFMYPLKMNHQNFTLEGTLKKYEWEKKSSENDQLTGHFQSFFVFVFHLVLFFFFRAFFFFFFFKSPEKTVNLVK